MKEDRMLKGLLALIAVALWGLLLRPLWTPGPVQAQGPEKPEMPAIQAFEVYKNRLWIVDSQYITAVTCYSNGKLEVLGRLKRP